MHLAQKIILILILKLILNPSEVKIPFNLVLLG